MNKMLVCYLKLSAFSQISSSNSPFLTADDIGGGGTRKITVEVMDTGQGKPCFAMLTAPFSSRIALTVLTLSQKWCLEDNDVAIPRSDVLRRIGAE